MAEIDLVPLHELIGKYAPQGVETHPKYPHLREIYERGVRDRRASRFILADVQEALDAHPDSGSGTSGW